MWRSITIPCQPEIPGIRAGLVNMRVSSAAYP